MNTTTATKRKQTNYNVEEAAGNCWDWQIHQVCLLFIKLVQQWVDVEFSVPAIWVRHWTLVYDVHLAVAIYLVGAAGGGY